MSKEIIQELLKLLTNFSFDQIIIIVLFAILSKKPVMMFVAKFYKTKKLMQASNEEIIRLLNAKNKENTDFYKTIIKKLNKLLKK